MVHDVLVFEDVKVVLILILDLCVSLDARVRVRKHRDQHVHEHNIGEQHVHPHQRECKGHLTKHIDVELGVHVPEGLPIECQGLSLHASAATATAAEHVDGRQQTPVDRVRRVDH